MKVIIGDSLPKMERCPQREHKADGLVFNNTNYTKRERDPRNEANRGYSFFKRVAMMARAVLGESGTTAPLSSSSRSTPVLPTSLTEECWEAVLQAHACEGKRSVWYALVR